MSAGGEILVDALGVHAGPRQRPSAMNDLRLGAVALGGAHLADEHGWDRRQRPGPGCNPALLDATGLPALLGPPPTGAGGHAENGRIPSAKSPRARKRRRGSGGNPLPERETTPPTAVGAVNEGAARISPTASGRHPDAFAPAQAVAMIRLTCRRPLACRRLGVALTPPIPASPESGPTCPRSRCRAGPAWRCGRPPPARRRGSRRKAGTGRGSSRCRPAPTRRRC